MIDWYFTLNMHGTYEILINLNSFYRKTVQSPALFRGICLIYKTTVEGCSFRDSVIFSEIKR